MPRTIKTTLELGGESAYKKGLQSVDRALKMMSGEVKDATAKFAENAKSQENAKAVMESYQKLIEQQKVKVDSLKDAVATCAKKHEEASKAYEKAADEHGKNSDEAQKAADALLKAEANLDKYTTKLKSTEKYLDKTTSDMRKFGESAKETKKTSSAFEKVSHQAKNVKQTLEPVVHVCSNITKTAGKISFKAAQAGAKTLSTSIKTASKAFAAYTTATVGAAKAMFSNIESTREYRNDLAKLEQGANTSGNSFGKIKSELTNLTALTGESDSSIEALSNLMSTGFSDSQISSAVDSLSGAVIKFPDTLKIESLADSLQETIATGAGTGQFAELIERSGGSLDNFNAGLENCSGAAERQQYALQWLADSGLANVNAEYEKSHKALLDYEKAEQAVTDANAKIAESAMPIAASFKSGYAGILSAFADVISGTDKNGAELSAKITEFVNNMAAMATQYLPVLLTAVNTLIQSIITNLPTLLVQILPTLLTGFNTLISGVIAAIPVILPVLIEGFVMLFGGMIDSLNLVIEQLLPLLPDMITQIVGALLENLPAFIEGALQLFLGILQSVDQMIEQLVPKLPEIITKICDTLIEHLPEIIQAGFDILVGLINGITQCIPSLVAKLPEVIDSIVGSLTSSEGLGQLIDAGIALIIALAEGLPKAIPQLVMAIPQIIAAIVGELCQHDWLQVGIDIVKGLANGLIDGVNVIWSKIKEMASNLLDSIKSALGIHSPSKLFREEVGTYLGQGVVVGFVDSMEKGTKAMQDAIPKNFDTAVNADVSMITRNGGINATAAGVSSGFTAIFETVNIYSGDDVKDMAYKFELERKRAQMALGVI